MVTGLTDEELAVLTMYADGDIAHNIAHDLAVPVSAVRPTSSHTPAATIYKPSKNSPNRHRPSLPNPARPWPTSSPSASPTGNWTTGADTTTSTPTPPPPAPAYHAPGR